MTACFPEIPLDAACNDDTLSYSVEDLQAMGCEEIDDAGKADWFSCTCPVGEHVCGYLFCCEDDYDLHWEPATASDWDIIDLVSEYQAQTPSYIIEDLEAATDNELADAYSVSFEQYIDDGLGEGSRDLAVEITHGLIEVPFETFLERFDPAEWGLNLDHYLGGELRVFESDVQGRPTAQVERMVLSPFPCDWETPLSNQDMTKVERIVYDFDSVTVYWRVMYSDNGSTLSDVGTVSFLRHGDDTLVEFHSAHRLGTPLGTALPNSIAMLTLPDFFSDHLRYYRQLVTY